MTDTLFQLGTKDRSLLAEARRRAGGESSLVVGLLDVARDRFASAVALSTCERLEVYAFGNASDVVGLARDMNRLVASDHASDAIERRVGSAVTKHLFRVSAGLDSRLIGEPQILGQVSRAVAMDFSGTQRDGRLARLFADAVGCGRRVRAHTSLGRVSTSCVDATLTLLRSRPPAASQPSIAVLGSGTLGRELAERLTSDGLYRITIFARHPDHVARNSSAVGACVVPLDALADRLNTFDVAIAATSSPNALITLKHVAERTTALLAIDLGVPANIDPAVGSLRHVSLVTLDDLLVGQDSARDVAARAGAIVDAASARWSQRWLAGATSPTASTQRRPRTSTPHIEEEVA